MLLAQALALLLSQTPGAQPPAPAPATPRTAKKAATAKKTATPKPPTTRFDEPPLVATVAWHISVIPEQEHEIFYRTKRFYLRTRDGRWYYSGTYKGNWVYLETDRVPEDLAKIPLGKYRRYRPSEAAPLMRADPLVASPFDVVRPIPVDEDDNH